MLNRDFDGLDDAVAKQDQESAQRSAQRMWLKPGESRRIVFLDDKPVSIWECSLRINGKWGNFVQLHTPEAQALAERFGQRAYYATIFTVLDRSEYKDKKGVIHSDQKRLLVVRPAIAKMLKEKRDRWRGLVGKEVIVSRKNDKNDPSSGSDFELALNAEGSALKPDLSKVKDITPFDYEAIFQPLAMNLIEAKFRAAGDASAAGASVSLTETDTTDSDIPF